MGFDLHMTPGQGNLYQESGLSSDSYGYKCIGGKNFKSPKKLLFRKTDHNKHGILIILLLTSYLFQGALQTKTYNQQYKIASSAGTPTQPSKDPTKVYQVGVSISNPETDPISALREEKLRQIMRDSNQSNYALFNHKLSERKLDLVYRNSLRLDIWERLIEIRRENRRIGIFKISKELSFWEVCIGILLVCGLIWVLLFLSTLVQTLREYVDEIIFNAILEITMDFLVLAAVFTVFNIVSLYNLAIPFQLVVNLEQIAVGGYTFILVWIGAGVHKVFVSQLRINVWDEFEGQVSEQSEVFKRFSHIKTEQKGRKLTKEETVELERLEQIITYLNLRDDFIDPSFLPAVRESMFRADFPFSDYLTIVHAKTLTSYMKFRTWCYLEVLLVFLGLIFLIQTHSDFLLLVLPVCTFLGCILLVLVSHLQMKSILSQCAGKIKHEDLIEFTQVSGRNQGYKISAFPQFISTKDESTSTMLGVQNLQERLFWLRSPDFMISLLKAAEILIYSLLVIGSPILFYFWDENLGYFGVLLLTEVCVVVLLMVYLPRTILDFSVCTNIVMLRDMVSAEEAVEEQKRLLGQSYQAVYR